MDNNEFYNWLLTEKQMSTRAAKDVISRCRRICKMCDATSIDTVSISALESCTEFAEKSMFIKSKLKRALTLCSEYGDNE